MHKNKIDRVFRMIVDKKELSMAQDGVRPGMARRSQFRIWFW